MIIDKTILAKYTPYFHDGGVIDIQHKQDGSELIISMESWVIDPDDLHDSIPLSEEQTIKGKLHLIGIRNIKVNGEGFEDFLKMLYDSSDLLDFNIKGTKVSLGIQWVNFRPKPDVNEFSFVEVEVDDLYWENIPDLHDPFT